MSANINRVVGLILVGFALLTLGMTYWTVVRGDELLALPYNARTVEFEKLVQRGRILDRNGAVLAETRMTPQGGQRVYPYTPLAPVLGYSSLRYGQGGVEAAFNAALRGYVDANSWAAVRYRLLHETPVGHDVYLTLDLRLQQEADRLLGQRRGAIILLDKTGAILAMASHPSYDPNRLDETFPQLSADPAAPLLNRATQGLYPPGSVWKTATLSAALDAGTTGLNRVYNDGAETLTVSGFPIRCNNNPPGVNSFDLAHAFGYSCNLTFARLALELGADRYTRYADAFHATTDLPLEIPVAKSRLANDDLSNPVLLASTGFGQGELQQTPLSIAMLGATAVNGGRLPRPHLLKEIHDTSGRTVETGQAGDLGAPIRPETAQQVLQAMEVAVTDGYANGAKVQGVRVGGKTGTAQTGGPTTTPHAWFLGVAPIDNPQYSVVVMIENGGEGSTVAAPLAGRMLAAALQK